MNRERRLSPATFAVCAAVALTLSLDRDFARGQGADYSRGFEMMIGLGLPDTSGWEYVKVERYDGSSLEEMLGVELEGNAWLEPEADADGLRRMTSDGVSLVAYMDSRPDDYETYAEWQRKALSAGLQPDRFGTEVQIREIDERADARKLLDALAEGLADGDVREGILHARDPVAALFFLATQWHQRGLQEEAAALVEALFEHLPRRQALVEAAMGRLANERHAAAVRRFRGSGDWALLEQDLQTVLEAFPQMWSERPLTAKLHALVQDRIAGGARPVEPAEGLPLTEEQVAWWQTLTEGAAADGEDEGEGDDAAPARRSISPDQAGRQWAQARLPWPEDSVELRHLGLGEGGARPYDVANGWDWLAVMAAGLGDDTLVAPDLSSALGGSHFHRSYHYSSRRGNELEEPPAELSEDEVEERWAQFDRPQTRDDIANAFLRSALPRTDLISHRFWSSAETEDIVAAVQDWHSRLDGKEGREVIELYLQEGGDTEKGWAAALLARTGNEGELERLEALALASPQRSFDTATEILRRRREEGAGFYEAFVARLKEDYLGSRLGSRTREVDEAALEAEFESNYEHQLQRLRALVSGEGFREMLAPFVAGEKPFQTFMIEVSMLSMGDFGQGDAEAAFEGVLEMGPGRASDQMQLLGFGMRIAQGVLESESGDDDAEDPSDARRRLPDWLVELCSALVEASDAIGTVPGALTGADTLARSVYYYLEFLTAPQEMAHAYRDFEGLPQPIVWAHVEARGRALLAGEELPEPPSAEEVPEERRLEIEAGIERLSQPGWAEWVESLTAAEAMVLRDAMAEDEPSPAGRAASLRIREVRLPTGGDWSEAWSGLEGAEFSPEFVDRLLDLCQAEAEGEGGGADGTLVFGPLHTGIRVEVARPGEGGGLLQAYGLGGAEDYRDPTEPLSVSAMVYAVWMTAGGNASTLRLRSPEGEWSLSEDESSVGGFYGLPFPSLVAGEELAASLEEFIDEAIAGQAIFGFGTELFESEADEDA